MKAAFYTLGCKVNQYETQAMEQILRENGHQIVPPETDADAYIINTCSVTAVSDRKSRQAARKFRKLHPEAILALCGCFPQTHPEEAQNLVRELHIDLLAGTGDRAHFIRHLEELFIVRQSCAENGHAGNTSYTPEAETEKACGIPSAFSYREMEVLPAGSLENRTRAMLKIEDGCANFCSYCIIPYARGAVRSLPTDEAVEQAVRLSGAGYREIVITGIEISSWGKDLKNGQNLSDLIEQLCIAVPETRIRLGSLEPRTITEDFCRKLHIYSNLCPQFHLSLQSGCDETLKRMRRRYTTAEYAQSVALLRQYFPRPAITTDIITGFPGETEQEFQQTLDFLEQIRFSRIHIFPYSIRPGTPAAEMPQIPKAVREARARLAQKKASELHLAWLRECVGEVHPVLFEQPEDSQQNNRHDISDTTDSLPEAGKLRKTERFYGHAANYAEVCVENPRGLDLHNQIYPVRIMDTDGEILFGVLSDADSCT